MPHTNWLSAVLVVLGCARIALAAEEAQFRAVQCEGTYPHHLQGLCTDDRQAIFWSLTTRVVKTDIDGNILVDLPVENHHGDLCYHDGRVYVAVNLGKFNDPQGNADSWVYVYDVNDLSLIAKHEIQQVVHGAGGIAYHDGRFLVVGGLPEGVEENYVYEFDPQFHFRRRHVLKSGWTRLGIQTATFADGRWWFGCYGNPPILLIADESLQTVQRHEFDCSLGIVPIGDDRFLVGGGTCAQGVGCTGRAIVAMPDDKQGLSVRETPQLSFNQEPDRLLIDRGNATIAEYVFQDDQVLRPYFRHLKTPSGVQLTRNHPPVTGVDLDDHATMHPGLWLAFGDLGRADFWRNKGRVRHERFVEDPAAGGGHGSFAAVNVYEADGRTICREECRVRIEVVPSGYLLDWTSTFSPTDGEFAFGDQEEMGLGIRVATPLAVKRGGEITNSEGGKNEAAVWGRQADWCAYHGAIDGRQVGIALMPHPDNFRRSWFHARDYGLLVANPFGRQAFTKGEPSRVVVKPGEPLTLRFGVFVYDVPTGKSPDVSAAYQTYLAD